MLSFCKEWMVKLLCTGSPCTGADALEAARHGMKGLFLLGGQHRSWGMKGLCSCPGERRELLLMQVSRAAEAPCCSKTRV